MREDSPLLNDSTRIINYTSDESIPQFVQNPHLKKQRYKYAIPSQESEEQIKDRFISIKICYVAMFLSAVSFTITMSSMWPFLQEIDKTTSTDFLGWIVSAFSVGQLIASPLFGYWANQINCHKIPIVTCLLITAAANVLYLYLESFKYVDFVSPKYWMLASRFIMGIGAASAAVIRSYVSSATTVKERTATLANISASQGLGFIFGPLIQAAFYPIGFPGLIKTNLFHLNIYTSPALLSIVVYLVVALLMIYKFTEYLVLDSSTVDISKILESNSISINDQNDALSESLKQLPPPDYTAVSLALFLFFINCFVFSFYETLTTPLTIDMYAWTKTEATFYDGLILGGLSFFSVVVVLISKFLVTIVKEKVVMLGSYIILFWSIFCLLPWGNKYPSVQIPTIEPGEKNTTMSHLNTTITAFVSSSTNEVPRGCPLNYEWCLYTPIIELYQFVFAFILLASAYSVSNVMSFTIYSKLLGPKPQGLMMGLLTSCGSLSRAVGPVVVSYLYGIYGPRVSFITLDLIVLFAILVIVFTFKRYEPYRF